MSVLGNYSPKNGAKVNKKYLLNKVFIDVFSNIQLIRRIFASAQSDNCSPSWAKGNDNSSWAISILLLFCLCGYKCLQLKVGIFLLFIAWGESVHLYEFVAVAHSLQVLHKMLLRDDYSCPVVVGVKTERLLFL